VVCRLPLRQLVLGDALALDRPVIGRLLSRPEDSDRRNYRTKPLTSFLEIALPALKRAGSREPTRSVRPKIQTFLFIALAVLAAASFTAAFASPVAFWASALSS
jgi:hypothetical protein